MKQKNSLILIVMILAVILVMAAYGTFYHFLNKKMAEAAEKENQIVLLKQKQEEIVTQKKLIDESKEMRSALEKYFVAEDDIVVFLEAFEALAQVTGTTIELSSLGVKNEDEGNQTALSLAVESEGSYAGVYHLLRLMETLPYEITIGQITLSRTATAIDPGSLPTWQLSTTFEIRSFIPSSSL